MTLKRRLKRLEAAAPPSKPSAGSFTGEPGGCEALYLQELEWHEAGESNLIHDPEAETFYAPSGEFALNRHRVDVRAWFAG